MALRVIRENNRSEGRKPVTGVAIIAGQPVIMAASNEVRTYNDGTFAAIPYGIAIETTTQLPIAPASGLVAGEGYDYTNFARGGLVSAFITGSELELYDDGRGAPYVAGDTYALNGPVYAKEDGLVTSAVGGGRQLIGSVVDFDAATNPTRLRIKFSI